MKQDSLYSRIEKPDYIVNPDDISEKFCRHDYLVHITAQDITFLVNADNDQEAIDCIIDFCREIGLNGLVASYEELINEETDEEIDEYVRGGNEDLYLTTYNIRIDEVR